jgi:SOS-response transcriptional repressor LexA
MKKRKKTSKVVNLELGKRVAVARRAVSPPMTQVELAKAAGLTQTAIAEIEAGRIRRPKKLRELARALKVSEASLLGEQEENASGNSFIYGQLGTVEIPVVGRVEPGVFRVHEQFDDVAPATIVGAQDARFPGAKIVAFVVGGDSMVGRNIHDGDIAITVDFADSHLPLRDRMVVVVQRTRDGGQTLEWTIKEVETHRDHIDLIPRSPNKRYKPIIVKSDYNPITGGLADDGAEIKILAVVLRVTKEIEVR